MSEENVKGRAPLVGLNEPQDAAIRGTHSPELKVHRYSYARPVF
jgi:hypothetical protein